MRAAAGLSATSLEPDENTFTGLCLIFIAGMPFSSEGAKRKKPVPRLDKEIAAAELREDGAVFREALENAAKLADMKALLQKLRESHDG